MALVHDDEVEEIPRIVAVKPGPVGVAGKSLVDREVHLAAFHRFAVDLVTRLPERRKYLRLRLVHEDVAIRKVQDSGTPIRSSFIPSGVPELPANLKGDDGLAGSRREREENPFLALEHGLH